MTRQEIDTLWFRAMHESIKDNEDFTRYHFAALVAAAERERAIAVIKGMTNEVQSSLEQAYRDGAAAEREVCAKMCESYVAEGIGREMAEAIRARGEK